MPNTAIDRATRMNMPNVTRSFYSTERWSDAVAEGVSTPVNGAGRG